MHCTLPSSLQRVRSVLLVPDESDAYVKTTKQPYLKINILRGAKGTYITSGGLPTLSSNSCQNYKLLSTPLPRTTGFTAQEPMSVLVGVRIHKLVYNIKICFHICDFFLLAFFFLFNKVGVEHLKELHTDCVSYSYHLARGLMICG